MFCFLVAATVAFALVAVEGVGLDETIMAGGVLSLHIVLGEDLTAFDKAAKGSWAGLSPVVDSSRPLVSEGRVQGEVNCSLLSPSNDDCSGELTKP